MEAVTRESKRWAPHQTHCQIETCGRFGHTVFDLGERGAIRVCIYHDVLLQSYALRVSRAVPDRRALPPDGPDIGADVPGGGAV